jgi:hypothetical protein
MEPVRCANCQSLQRRVHDLQAENERLRPAQVPQDVRIVAAGALQGVGRQRQPSVGFPGLWGITRVGVLSILRRSWLRAARPGLPHPARPPWPEQGLVPQTPARGLAMPRLAAVVLCACLPLGLLAAPAPLPRAWFSGWDKPVDPRGDCQFDREADKLTVTVPGGWPRPPAGPGRWLNFPRLLRDVEGDFVVSVRVGGAFRPTGRDGCHAAGLLLTDGETAFVLGRGAAAEGFPKGGDPGAVLPRPLGTFLLGGGDELYASGLPLGQPEYLRLERRGNELRAAFSADGKTWGRFRRPPPEVKLPRKMKVGVVVEATAPGQFKPWFDRFQLSRPGK